MKYNKKYFHKPVKEIRLKIQFTTQFQHYLLWHIIAILFSMNRVRWIYASICNALDAAPRHLPVVYFYRNYHAYSIHLGYLFIRRVTAIESKLKFCYALILLNEIQLSTIIHNNKYILLMKFV